MANDNAVKIYLDQKDFSSMARGLNGEAGYEKFLAIFYYLVQLVESRKILIYFSSFHIVESLRYEALHNELWAHHCDIIDKLTQGNCIIFFQEIKTRELELFLSEEFEIQTDLRKVDYPYGKYSDAIRIGDFSNISAKKAINTQLRKKLLSTGLSRNQRREIIKKMTPLWWKKHIMKMEQEDYNNLISSLRNNEKPNNFIEDLQKFLDRDSFATFILGTYQEQQVIINNFFKNVFHFKQLVHRYGKLFPELKEIANLPEKSFENLERIIKICQKGQQLLGHSVVDYDHLQQDLKHSVLTDLKSEINMYAAKHKFSSKRAETILIDSNLAVMPIFHSLILFGIKYLKTHDVKNRSRNPLVSDATDLQHLRYIPYVDCFVTDGFMHSVSKEIAFKSFNTRVFKCLQDLQSWLKNSLK